MVPLTAVAWKPSGMCRSDFTVPLDLSGQAVSLSNFEDCVCAGLDFTEWSFLETLVASGVCF